ncbi:argonaute-like protein [Epithele typhae]|uniref:argonaute-like protein n=1 Tax=Epithele typhae TaxID=378194 RepID=UPI0020080169|nr:argonaute-like protein [Epithele typhae]KAH9914769.1 argonaute-like protein [Epithele typhae]
MPPRGNPDRGRGGPRGGGGGGSRGGSRGGTGSRGGAPSTRGGSVAGGPPGPAIRAAPASVAGGLPEGHITTVGVKRPSFGNSGRLTRSVSRLGVCVTVAHAHLACPVITPASRPLPARLNMEIIRRLQTVVAPQVFTPRAVYDGRANMYCTRELPFGPSGSHKASSLRSAQPAATEGRPRGPKTYTVKLTHAATINPEVLSRFLKGKQSQDNAILTAIQALNVAVRMEPYSRYPFNTRSFFTSQGSRDIGSGMHLWRGYFQSVRPSFGRMLINVDISAAVMYAPGPVIQVAFQVLEMPPNTNPEALAPAKGFPERARGKLERFLRGLRVHVQIPGQPPIGNRPARTVQGLSTVGADSYRFDLETGEKISVAQHFQRTHNYKLRHPGVVCVQIGKGMFPLEVCVIPEGQLMRKQLPPEKTDAMVQFSTQKPHDRLGSIVQALGVLAYGQSEYVRQFGMQLAKNDPLAIDARIIDTPTLKYGPGSRQPTVRPRDGAWNMIDKKFWKSALIKRWVVVVYEREQRYNRNTAGEMVQGLLFALNAAGVVVQEPDPVIRYQTIQQGRVADHLKEAGRQCLLKNKNAGGPDLIVVVLPMASVDIYTAVKHFGDCSQGVATQCMQASKCSRAKPQYYANVALKINVKLGGINTVPDSRSVPVLTDPHNPTIVMGADVIHPAPGTQGRPSFTSLVGNVDSDTAKYVAELQVQAGRQEMIEGLEEMAGKIIKMYQSYRSQAEGKRGVAPTRIIFYRDGVSEGEFQQVLDYELPQLKRACEAAGVQPKITVIVVGKRHHVRFFPGGGDSDRSGNCLPGLVGTSRPAHYSVLYDENKFTPDSIQALSFALCHVYARSTRSVSIPAPVYYADIVCSRAKYHYDPDGSQHLSMEESGTHMGSAEANTQLEAFRAGFRPLNEKIRKLMYFS